MVELAYVFLGIHLAGMMLMWTGAVISLRKDGKWVLFFGIILIGVVWEILMPLIIYLTEKKRKEELERKANMTLEERIIELEKKLVATKERYLNKVVAAEKLKESLGVDTSFDKLKEKLEKWYAEELLDIKTEIAELKKKLADAEEADKLAESLKNED